MELVLLVFIVSLLASILSGIAGGGGGFINMPFLLFLGLSPQQAIATGKMAGVGVSFGSLSAFRGKHLVRRRLAAPLIIITLIAAFNAGWVIPLIDPGLFQRVIGALLIVLIPTLFINKPAFKPGERSGWAIRAGYGLFTVLTFLQTIVGTGLGSLINLVLMYCFGLTALEANATKRLTQSIQAVIVFVLLLLQGFVILSLGIATMAGALLGGYIGSNIAIKKGNKFVKIVLAAVMLISGIALLIGVKG